MQRMANGRHCAIAAPDVQATSTVITPPLANSVVNAVPTAHRPLTARATASLYTHAFVKVTACSTFDIPWIAECGGGAVWGDR